jgi:CelD/BcsL family acetyltransferase involved in cellulose biosynthesis
MHLSVVNRIEDIPDKFRALFDEAERQSFFLGFAWLRLYCSSLLDVGDEVRIYLVEDRGSEPVAVLPLRLSKQERLPGSDWRRALYGLSNYYSSLYAPIVTADGERSDAAIRLLADHLMRERPRWQLVNLRPLDVDAPSYSALRAAFHQAGFAVQPYFCFGNWYLETAGRTFEQYFSSLPAQLRNTIRRKEARLDRRSDVRYELVTMPDGVPAAMDAYEAIYRRSWKKSEPRPEFIRALAVDAASRGWLRMGVIYIAGEPAAAQIWIVCHGTASIYKLAYDDKFAPHSVGTILTKRLMQFVIDVDGVSCVDYLTGDDAYKRDWMSNRRERWGLIAFNPSFLSGALLAVRHLGGARAKRLAGFFFRRGSKHSDG